MDWTSGYRADIDYTYGYYRELAPGMIDFALAYAGFEPPQRGALRYLELGYGQGMSANIHAAACPGQFWGADFNPAHASNAQTLARISEAPAEFTDESFAEMLGRDDMPPMDYIVLHGIWSWVSDENRQVIVDTIRKRLRVGGALYFSYNTLPGWAMAMPLRHILALHAKAAGSDVQGIVGSIDAAIDFGRKLSDAGARYFQANPMAKARLDAIAGQNRHYVAHEYFQEVWTPMYFSEVHDRLAEAKLSYATCAAVLEQMDPFNLTVPQREMLNGYPGGVLRETVRDYMLNQQFRRDLYTRGARKMSPLERMERLYAIKVTTLSPTPAPIKVDTVLGPLNLLQEIYQPVIDHLHKHAAAPQTIAQMSEDPALAALAPGALLESLAVLIGAGRAHPVQSDEDIAIAAPRCARLNAELLERSRISGDVTCLASPVIGGGVGVARFEQMFLWARAKGAKTPADWARMAWETLSRQNQSLIKDGEMLKTAEANLEELTAQAEALDGDRLALLRHLKVID
ncbi:MAG: class I SAM-dependent methyltransferase [Caulobacteraceae bacterium]|nr:class I SAM-dependent methyltransferase [Caulobacteraceae bacterium]